MKQFLKHNEQDYLSKITTDGIDGKTALTPSHIMVRAQDLLDMINELEESRRDLHNQLLREHREE